MGLEGAVEGGTWILKDCLSLLGVLVACAVVQPSSSTVTVRLLNVSPEPVTIYAQKKIAYAEEIGDIVCSGDTANPDQGYNETERKTTMGPRTRHRHGTRTPTKGDILPAPCLLR